jgi:hypothetical protein
MNLEIWSFELQHAAGGRGWWLAMVWYGYHIQEINDARWTSTRYRGTRQARVPYRIEYPRVSLALIARGQRPVVCQLPTINITHIFKVMYVLRMT